MNAREPEFEESRDGHERATAVVEETGLPEDNPFSDVVNQLHEDGKSWGDIFETLNEVFDVVDAAALEEGWELVPEWRVATVVDDELSTSGKRFEFYKRTAKTADEAEEMVGRHTGYPVESSKTEQIGVAKVA